MTQPTQEGAVGDANETPIVDAAEPTIEDRFAAFDEIEEEGEPEAVEEEAPEAEADEPTEDDIETEDEPELPAIEPPVSWKADAKDAFAKLPPELQKVVSERETERERFVQLKAQEAATTRQRVEQAAYEHIAELQRQTAETLEQYVAQPMPQQPDIRLLQTGHEEHRVLFYQQQAAFEQATAQREQAQRQAEQARAEQARYQQAIEAQEAEAFRATLAEQFPEFLDPSQNTKLQQELGSIASELGYSHEQIAEARATDILAMRKAADWKAKAAKYDALMSKKMEKVREAKALPKVSRPGAAQPKGAQDQARFQEARKKMRGGDNAAALDVFSRFV
jgi:hypothetical protein